MFEKVEEHFFPLENILRKKLYNLYKDRDIDELKQIIVEVEIKNVYLMKEIENLKNINMRLEQELIDEKNNKAFKNLFNERKKKKTNLD
jgi:DNA topoisomerase VI subunit A